MIALLSFQICGELNTTVQDVPIILANALPEATSRFFPPVCSISIGQAVRLGLGNSGYNCESIICNSFNVLLEFSRKRKSVQNIRECMHAHATESGKDGRKRYVHLHAGL